MDGRKRPWLRLVSDEYAVTEERRTELEKSAEVVARTFRISRTQLIYLLVCGPSWESDQITDGPTQGELKALEGDQSGNCERCDGLGVGGPDLETCFQCHGSGLRPVGP